ncbi:inorganic diphosphatase [Acuticoccus sp. MNP-M23]|uniref:inorganic diphosphatase n=1 Tax=Acuticoccus sp. MNP-M23 TaxID=3072793 RepID=UPI002815502B|nr:inorganic diphosphatase [Acuticoccus sp. MNP-M23]WMS43194.1 inorganic diphosphatase [Acuticoccus sp. MNP-M23]
MIRLDALTLGAAPPEDINVLITVSCGAEPFDVRVDDRSGALTVSQLLHSTMRTPGNLGVIPHTQGDNADPLQALVLTSHVLAPGMVIAARPVGVLYVSGDAADEATVLAVPAARLSARHAAIANYTDLPSGELRQIAHFFSHYRDMEDARPARSAGWGDVSEARRVIMEASERVRDHLPLIDR